MNRVPVLLFTLLLALSAPVVAFPPGSLVDGTPDAGPVDAVSPTTAVEAPNNTTATLPLDDVSLSNRTTATVDVSGSLSIGTTELDERYGEAMVDDRIESADSREEKSAILETELDRIDVRIDHLHEREQRVYRAYSNGELTDREFLREVARIHVEAQQIHETLDRVDLYARQISDLSMNQRAQGLIVEISGFEGPVRDRIVSAMRGEAEEVTVFVEIGQNGIVLSMIDGNTFVREAYRGDQRDRTAAAGKRLSDFERKVEAHYPWAWENQDTFDSRGVIDTGVYRIVLTHPQGQVTSYLDTDTENPYREIQSLHLDRMPVTEEANVTEEGLRVAVDRTYPGGPVRVTLTDNETGLPAPGFVELDDGHLVSIDDDGVAWFIAPNDDFSMNVTSDSTTVSIRVSQE